MGPALLDFGGEITAVDANLIDSAIIRALQHAADGTSVTDNAIGRYSGGLSTKIHVAVDQDGLSLKLLLSSGHASGMRTAALPAYLAATTVVCNRGFDSNAMLHLIAITGALPKVPSCSKRIVRWTVDPAIYGQSNLIERFFCRLRQFRRIATLARSLLAAALLVSIRMWLKAYESTH